MIASRIRRTIPTYNNILEPHKQARLVWTNNYTLKFDGTKSIDQIFRINSLYAPDLNGGSTTQPFGFDQFALMFNHYVVTGAKYTVRIFPITLAGETFSNNLITFFAGIDDDAALLESTNKAIKECGNFQYREKQDSAIDWDTATGGITFNGLWSADKYFNAKVKDNISNYGANMSNNPSELACIHVGAVSSLDPQVNITTSSYRLDVRIEFIATFSERRQIATS